MIQMNNITTLSETTTTTTTSATDHPNYDTREHSSACSIHLNSYLKPIIYGGLDGIITTFATVTSVAGADLQVAVIVVLGVAHLLADGLAMGMGDAISETSELQKAASNRARYRALYNQNPSLYEGKLVDIYASNGMSREHAVLFVGTLTQYPEILVDYLLIETIGVLPSAEPKLIELQESGPCLQCHPCLPLSPYLKSGLVTMFSFIFFGSIPLLPYIIVLFPFLNIHLSSNDQLWIAIVTTTSTLFLLGVIQHVLVHNDHQDDDMETTNRELGTNYSCCRQPSSWWARFKSGMIMTLNGSFAAGVGFATGWILKNVMNIY